MITRFSLCRFTYSQKGYSILKINTDYTAYRFFLHIYILTRNLWSGILHLEETQGSLGLQSKPMLQQQREEKEPLQYN